MSISNKVFFVYDSELVKATSKIPNIKIRSRMVMDLIRTYGLFGKMDVVPARLANSEELLYFHSSSYLKFLERTTSANSGSSTTTTTDCLSSFSDSSNDADAIEELDGLEFGLGYDCPAFDNMKEFSEIVAGGSLTAAEGLVSGIAKVAINWCGGWHHAQRDEASGFCYVNDIVIAIHFLRTKFKKILYIDLDAHHGDGVENAFNFSKNIFTLSIHNFESGYFPGTGSISDIGLGKGKNYAINVPLKSGITDEPYFGIFSRVLNNLLQKFSPEAIVIQCGTDCLAGDPLGTFNLTEVALGKCCEKVLSLHLPTLILGGGGYNLANTARCWTYLTSIACGVHLNPEIPDHDYFIKYGPDFELSVTPTLRKDENDSKYINDLLDIIQGNIQRMQT